MANVIRHLPFGGSADELMVITTGEGRHWFNIRRPCERFGLSYAAECKRLRQLERGRDWEEIPSQPTPVFCIPRQGVYGWISRFRPEELTAPGAAAWLLLYQRECDKALQEHYEGPSAPPSPPAPSGGALTVEDALVAQAVALRDLSRKVVAVKGQVDELKAAHDAEIRRRARAAAELDNLPGEATPPTLNLRSLITRRVIRFAQAEGLPYETVYSACYRDLRDLHHCNVWARAKSRPGYNLLDIVQEANLLPEFLAIIDSKIHAKYGDLP